MKTVSYNIIISVALVALKSVRRDHKRYMQYIIYTKIISNKGKAGPNPGNQFSVKHPQDRWPEHHWKIEPKWCFSLPSDILDNTWIGETSPETSAIIKKFQVDTRISTTPEAIQHSYQDKCNSKAQLLALKRCKWELSISIIKKHLSQRVLVGWKLTLTGGRFFFLWQESQLPS